MDVQPSPLNFAYHGRIARAFIRGYFGSAEDLGVAGKYLRRTIICQVVAASIGMTVVLPLIIMAFDREAVAKFTDTKISPSEIYPGQTVTISWRGNQYRACNGEIRRTVIDSSGRYFNYAIEPTGGGTVRPSDARLTKEFMTPEGMTPGRAEYIAKVWRWCNWVQHWIWPMTEEHRTTFFVQDRDLKERSNVVPRDRSLAAFYWN